MPSCSYIAPPISANLSTGISQSSNTPHLHCAVWRWCPCDCSSSVSYCSESEPSSCPWEPPTGCDCNGDGYWALECGEDGLGPPCVEGRFFGEAVIVCRCPTVVGESVSSISISVSEASCSPNMPIYEIPFDIFDADDYVPQKIFPSNNEIPRRYWTWCPCLCDEDGHGCTGISYPHLEVGHSKCELPTCASTDGHWVSRGGDEDYPLGPPPDAGRFYGETVVVANCCLTISSSSIEQSFEISSSSGSCHPHQPYYDITMLGILHLLDEWDESLFGGMSPPEEGDAFCSIGTLCGMWLWCPCEDSMSSSCSTQYPVTENCPYPGGATGTGMEGPGIWLLISGDGSDGPPCIEGEYYGQVLFRCTCPPCSSSTAGCDYEASNPSPSLSQMGVLGQYSYWGEYGGFPVYENTGVTGFYLFFDDLGWAVATGIPIGEDDGYVCTGIGPVGTYEGTGGTCIGTFDIAAC